MVTLVKNANGTSRWSKPSTGESKWLEYCENCVGCEASRCTATDCDNYRNLVGAHVQKVFGGNDLFIVPLCDKCNQRTDTFCVDAELVPVPSRYSQW